MELSKISAHVESSIPSSTEEKQPGHFFLDTKKIERVSSQQINIEDSEKRFQTAATQDEAIAKIAQRCEGDEEVGYLISILKEISASNLKLAAVALKDGRYSDVKTFTANIAKAANAARDYEAVLDQKKV